jgi:hypothetical protein
LCECPKRPFVEAKKKNKRKRLRQKEQEREKNLKEEAFECCFFVSKLIKKKIAV